MNPWIYIDFIAFLIVALLTGFIIPQILLIAFRKNLFDEVDPRKIHQGAVPRLGGIAFFPTILFSILLIIGVGRRCFPDILNEILLQSSVSGLCFITCSLVAIYLVGMTDDLIGVKYRAKFIAQLLAAVLIVVGGIYFDNLHGFLGVYKLPYLLTILLTVFLIIFITNAINLIDGIDGLASGLSAIACAFYGYVFFKYGIHIYGMLAFATMGALASFFYYNVFGDARNYRKIFMGDTGALTIGLMLSTLSIRICQIEDFTADVNPAVIGLSPLLIPCFDVVRVSIHRIKARRNPFLPDKTHIHHKLLALGMSQRFAMPTIVVSNVILIMLNYLLCRYIDITLLFVLDLVLWVVVNSLLTRAIRNREMQTGLHNYD